jgi:hypothetical protein
MVDEDICGSLKSLKCFKGQFDYLFFVLVHVGCWLSRGIEPRRGWLGDLPCLVLCYDCLVASSNFVSESKR